MASCRSCGAEMVWGKTVAGKSIPLDANDFGDPIPKKEGNVRLTGRRRDGVPEVEIVKKADGGLFGDEPRFVSHFATCPQAEQWRGKR